MAADHVGDLKRIREELVKHRRTIAAGLAQAHGRGPSEHLDALTRCQGAIEAIDRAIREEERAAEVAAAASRRAFMRHEDDPYDDIDSLGG